MAEDENANIIPGAGDQTHPLPSDLNESGGDSTGGNAPFAPAHITPAEPEYGGDESIGGPEKSGAKSGKHHQPGESYYAHNE